MNSQIKVYVYSMTATGVILFLSFIVTYFGFVIWSPFVFHDFHILIDTAGFFAVFGLLSAFYGRLIMAIVPLREGHHVIEHASSNLWKMMVVTREFGMFALKPFSTAFSRPFIDRLFGARLGKNTVQCGTIIDPALVTIGDDTMVGQDSVITAHAVTGNSLVLKRVTIGNRVTIGVNAVIMPGVEIGDGAIIAANAVVPPFTTIPAGEFWGGVPARRIQPSPSTTESPHADLRITDEGIFRNVR